MSASGKVYTGRCVTPFGACMGSGVPQHLDGSTTCTGANTWAQVSAAKRLTPPSRNKHVQARDTATVIREGSEDEEVHLPREPADEAERLAARPDEDGGTIPPLDDTDALAAVALHLPCEQRRQVSMTADCVRQVWPSSRLVCAAVSDSSVDPKHFVTEARRLSRTAKPARQRTRQRNWHM